MHCELKQDELGERRVNTETNGTTYGILRGESQSRHPDSPGRIPRAPALLQLRDNLHWCACDGRAVFMDVEKDRYFCLPREANAAFLRLAAGNLVAGDEQRLDRVRARGLLTAAQPGEVLRPAPIAEPPVRNLSDDAVRPVPFRRIASLLTAELRQGRALRTRSLAEVLDELRNQPCGRGRASRGSDAVREIVAASRTVALITRSHDRCLVRSLAVFRVCRASGLAPKLVFGVIAHPFAAHCWVQIDGDVLVGGSEQARLFTPILVLA